MYNSTQSHRGSALLVGLIIVVLLTILTTSFLEKILGLGRTSGAIGNSAQAYTLATGLIEEQLMQSNMTRQAPWNIQTRVDTGVFTGRTLSAYTGGNLIPEQ
jgi:Tfp pilus assembly protein PilX